MKQLNNILAVFCVVFITAFTVLVVFFSPRWNLEDQIEPCVKLDKSWSLRVNGAETQMQNLPQRLQVPSSGNYSIERKIGIAEIIEGPSLFFTTRNTAVKIFSDNTEIYSYGFTEKFSLGRTSGTAVHFARLPQTGYENNIRIVFYPLEFDFSYVVPVMYIGTKFACVYFFIIQQFPFIVMSLLILLIGAVYLFLYAFSMMRKVGTDVFLKLGIFAVLCGIEVLLETSLPQLFIPNSFILDYLFSIILPAVPAAFLICCRKDPYFEALDSRIVNACMIISGVFILVILMSVFIPFISLVLVKQILFIYLVVFSLVLFFFSILKVIEHFHLFDELCVAFWLFALSFIIDTIRLSIIADYRYGALFTRFGILIFFVLRGIKALKYYYYSVEQVIRAKTLESLAYIDILTSLKNRLAFEEAQHNIITKNESAALVLLDVNGLKDINDKFGHSAGDVLLKRFAEILIQSFPSDKVYRIGGDEFCVLAEGMTPSLLADHLHHFEKTVEQYNCLPGVILLSSAVGSGIFNPLADKNFSLFFKRVDMEMYRDKRRKKQLDKVP